MIITQKFKRSVYRSYDDMYRDVVIRHRGERLAILEFDECGSGLSLTTHDPNNSAGYDISIKNATIVSWNDGVLTYRHHRPYNIGMVKIALDTQSGAIQWILFYRGSDEQNYYHLLTNEDE